MTLKLKELKELSFELFGMLLTNSVTNEQTIGSYGILKQELDLKSKYFLNKFAKQVSELLPAQEEQTDELMESDYDIQEMIKNFPPDLADKVGQVKTKETYPILFDILFATNS
jgi:hypothetical protein